MDTSLAVLIVLVAGYAGAVTWLARGFRPALVAAVGVLAGFGLMLATAHVWVPGTYLLAALEAALITYLTLAADLSRARVATAATVTGLMIGVASLVVSYLAVMALIGAAGVYLVLRRRLRTRPALFLMGGALGTLLAGSAAAFAVALSNM
jgi:hypothetical protein